MTEIALIQCSLVMKGDAQNHPGPSGLTALVHRTRVNKMLGTGMLWRTRILRSRSDSRRIQDAVQSMMAKNVCAMHSGTFWYMQAPPAKLLEQEDSAFWVTHGHPQKSEESFQFYSFITSNIPEATAHVLHRGCE